MFLFYVENAIFFYEFNNLRIKIYPMPPLIALNNVIAVLCSGKMTEQQGTPDQLPAEKGQGGAGATYKVPH